MYRNQILKMLINQWKTLIAQGVPPITINNCKNTDMLNYQVYGNAEYGKLPSEYKEVEYIENTGSSYIDTGLIGKSGYTLETELSFSALATGSYQYFAGYAYTGSADRLYYIRMANNSKALGYTYGSNNSQTSSFATLTENTWYKFKSVMKADLQQLYLDDVLLGGTTFEALSYDSSNPKNIYMFVSQYVNSTNGPTKAKCKYAKWYDENDNLIREFIPCYRKSDNVVGMYDLVEGVFYTNQGSEDFTKGNNANVVPSFDNPVKVYGVGDKTKNMLNVPKVYTFTSYPNLINLVDELELGVQYKVVWSKTIKGATYNPAMNLGGNVGWLYSMGEDGGSFTFTYTTLPENIYIYSNGANAARSAGITSTVEGLMIIRADENLDYEDYGYKIPIEVSGKNLLPSPYPTSITNGITFSDQDGKLKINGTASSTFWKNVYTFELPAGDYTFVEKNNIGVVSGHSVQLGVSGTPLLNVTVESSRSNNFSLSKSSIITLAFRFTSGITISNEELELMIIKRGNTTNFEKYITPSKTNVYVTSPIYKTGDKSDYIDYETQKTNRNVAELIVTGQENWEGGQNFFRFKMSSSNIVDGSVPVLDQKCNYAECKVVTVSGSEVGASVYYSSSLGGTYFRIRPYSSSSMSINEFKSLMQQYYAEGHPIKIYYPSNTETQEQTTLPSIMLNAGTNTVDVKTNIKSSNLYVQYKGK